MYHSFLIHSLSNINHSRIFYDPPPRVMEIKAKINKWDLIKIKSFCHNEGNYKQDEKTAFRMGENNSSEVTDKELISKVYKQLLQLNSRKINDPIKKWAKGLSRNFCKEDIQMANKHMKRCSTSLIIKNAHQNHNVVPFHNGQNGCYQKVYKQ